jgi:hypothetical protein
MSILVIDGVKYEALMPTNEHEFERMVKEHAKDIFGEQSIYLEKHKLRTKSGIGSIPDGYVIIFGSQPCWHIVEVELSSHPLYEHIVPQVSKFINGIKNPLTQKDIVDALYQEIDSDDFLKLRLKKAMGAAETYKFLSDLISKPPVVTIIIEKHTAELDEAVGALAHPQIKIVEFQTFTREGVGLAVHAHLFGPILIDLLESKSVVTRPPRVSSRNQLYQQFFRELIDEYCSQYPSQPKVKPLPQSWIGFGAGKSGFWFNWAFRGNRRFSVELYIDTGDKAKNKEHFDRIREGGTKFGITGISWERLDEKKASRVAMYTNGDIESIVSNVIERKKLLQWAIETMNNFSNKLSPVLKTL